jgi:flagellar hook-associated protein 1 FlgK
MANLLGSLGAAAYNLGAFGQALAVIENNVGNATTPGYARQRAILEALPFFAGGGQSGGVRVSHVETIRDRFLDFQVIASLQQKTYFEKLAQSLSQVESWFPLTGELSLGTAVDGLFHSFQELSASPGDFNLREQVLRSARDVAAAVETAYRGLTEARATLDQEAQGVAAEINGLADELVELNRARARLGAFSAGESATAARLTQLLERLGELVDYRLVTQQDGSLLVALPGGTPLVAGVFAYRLTAVPTGPRLEIRDQEGNDISGDLGGGQLGAILAARNGNLPGYLAELDQLAATLADAVNGQLAEGLDLAGLPGQPLFQYVSSAFTGSGRTAGTAGASTPAPPVSVTVSFTAGVTGAIAAALDSFFVASTPPAGLASGDTITVNFESADRTVRTSITTAPLTAGDTTATIATRLNDQVALNPLLAGRVSFADEGGNLKLVLADTAGQGFTFSAATSDPGFTSGLEAGGSVGGHSAREIAAALNAQVALDAGLSAAGIRFTAAGGEVRLDGNVPFTFTATDSPGGTGFVSGLGGTFTAGGSPAAATFAVTDLASREIAAAGPNSPGGNENALALGRLASQALGGGFTFTQFYARAVFQVGEDARRAAVAFTTQNQILLEAQNLRESLSGVSLDEEAARLLEFQKAYQATSRVIGVLDSLVDEVMGLLR